MSVAAAEKFVERQIEFEEGDAYKSDVIFPLVASLVEHAARNRPVRLVELGVGSGLMANHLKPGIVNEAILFDANPNILPYAADRYHSRGIPTRAISGDVASSLPIEEGGVDIILAINVLNQMPHPDIVFDRAHHYLSESGMLIVVVPDEANVQANPTHTRDRIRGVLHKKKTLYHFDETKIKVPFYSRQNLDYYHFYGRAGFIMWKGFRPVDPNRTDLLFTPKSMILTAHKVPIIQSDGRGTVTITSDTLRETALTAVMVQENAQDALIVLRDAQTGDPLAVPIPKEHPAVNKLIVLSSSTTNAPIIVRRIDLETQRAHQVLFRLFHHQELLAHYPHKEKTDRKK